MPKKKEEQSINTLVLLRWRNKIATEGETETKCGPESEWKTIQRLQHLGILPLCSHKSQTLLSMPTSACWLKLDIAVTWEGSVSAWQIQSGMLSASHLTEHRVPNGGAWERNKGAEGVCSNIEWTTIWATQYSQRSQGINHQWKSTHEVAHGSRCIGNRG